VGLGEFTVGSFKEFKLREELLGLVDKYNKQFYQSSGPRPLIGQEGALLKPKTKEEQENKYKNAMIVNPIAVPNPASCEENFSWMYLITPEYNKLIEEYNVEVGQNSALKEHFNYWFSMEKEKLEMERQFDEVKRERAKLHEQLQSMSQETEILE
jgi:hypothetical protein